MRWALKSENWAVLDENEKGVGVVLGLKALRKGRLLWVENFLGNYLSSSGESGDAESDGWIRFSTSFFSTIFLAVSGKV